MITVAFTPYIKGSRGYIELQELLKKSQDTEDLISLPNGLIETDQIEDLEGQEVKKILDVLSYEPHRALVVDARDPDLICNTLRDLQKMVGNPDFSARELRERFFIITQSSAQNILNQLITGVDQHLQTLLEKPYFDQIAFF